MRYEEIKDIVQGMISSKRFEHSLGVVKWAEILANKYNYDMENARIAAISHDCAKEYKKDDLINIALTNSLLLDEVTMSEPQLLHGPVGSVLAEEKLGIIDNEILQAIKYHTTGRANMILLEKIIYISDIIEESKDNKGLDIVRKTVLNDIDKAMLMCLDNTIEYVMSIKALLHPATIEARNDLILDKKRKGGLL